MDISEYNLNPVHICDNCGVPFRRDSQGTTIGHALCGKCVRTIEARTWFLIGTVCSSVFWIFILIMMWRSVII